MLTDDEQKFVKWWEENRERERSWRKQLSMGLPIGMMIGIGILINFETGWYERANMVANSQSTPLILIIAIILIAIFCSIFYKRHKWEMNDQRYKELKYKAKKNDSSADMQQQSTIKSQD